MPDAFQSVQQVIHALRSNPSNPASQVAIDMAKRYGYARAEQKGIQGVAKWQGPPVPIPTPKEFEDLVEELKKRCRRQNIDPGSLEDFVALEQPPAKVPTSGVQLSFQHHASDRQWQDTFRRFDQTLSSLSPSEQGIGCLEVIPGGLRYKGVTVDLSGEPLECIRAFLNSHHRRLSFSQLRDSVWGVGSYTTEATAKNKVSEARKALRSLRSLTGIPTDDRYDPIPNLDHGKNLAWELKFPD